MSSTPKYQVVLHYLKKNILSGRLPIGTTLPSIRRLQKEYTVSRNTILNAVQVLQDEGIISRNGSTRNGYTIVAEPEEVSGEGEAADHGTIKIILPFSHWNYVGNKFMETAERTFADNNISLLFSNNENSIELEAQVLQRIQERGPNYFDLLIIMTGASFNNPNVPVLQELQREVPVILFDRFIHGIDLNYIGIDNFDIGYTAAEYFIEKGHKSFAFLSGFDRISTIVDRLNGFRSSIEKSGLSLPKDRILTRPSLFEKFDSTTHAGEEMGRALLSAGNLPSAIFCGSDKVASSLIRTFENEGISIPDDVAIIGCDDDPLQCSFLGGRKITSFAYPFKELIQEILHVYNKHRTDLSGATRSVELKSRFIPGDTA